MLKDPLLFECYINTYAKFRSGVTHATKESADDKALPDRTACLRIVQNYYVGDGLPYNGELDSDDDVW